MRARYNYSMLVRAKLLIFENLTGFGLQDIRFNCRFTDIMRTTPTGDRLVDFRGFNSVVQNTIMPVSFGLSFEETVAINGPNVTAAPLNSSVSRASKGRGHGKSKSKNNEAGKVKTTAAEAGEKVKSRDISKSATHSEQGNVHPVGSFQYTSCVHCYFYASLNYSAGVQQVVLEKLCC